MPLEPNGKLIGGTGSSLFPVGNSLTFTASESGSLMLGINDDIAGLRDNLGELTVRVALER
jgi:hypothetical protein